MINKEKTVCVKAYISKDTYEVVKDVVGKAKKQCKGISISWFIENALCKYIEDAVKNGKF